MARSKKTTVDMSAHFTARQLIAYTLPAIAMMVFTSIYGVVDGLFISNFAGKTAFAAVNLIMPFVMILSTLGFMMGTGGSAIVAKTRGEGDDARANGYFSLFVCFTLVMGVAFAILGFAFMPQVARALGASEEMLADCALYGRILMISLPFYMLQYAFQAFASTAGKPEFGLKVIVAAGVANMVLDALFVGLFGWGVAGAAAATVVSEYIGGVVPLVYFARPDNPSLLRLTRPSHSWAALGRACVNGSSEMMASIAFNIVAVVYNLQLMAYLGEDGVAAYGTVMYAGMMMSAVIEGYCMGTAPLMSFQHGARNDAEKRSILRKSLAVMAASGVGMFVLAEALAWPVAWIFARYDAGLMALTIRAMRIFALCLVFMGISMYGSSLFTALGNGVVSAAISFLRALVFEVGSVLLLPRILGADGIWLSSVAAEVVSFVLTTALIYVYAPRYGLSKRPRRTRRDGGAGLAGMR